MNNVFRLFPTDKFTLESARRILPTVIHITNKYKERLDKMFYNEKMNNKEFDDLVNKEVETWKAKLAKLGVEAKGLWTVDFDCGNGYYYWKLGDTKLEHFHAYNEGVLHRVKIS